ncbi:MAG: hypothetical protein ACRDD9_04325 [Shewanella sp.]
MVISETTVRPMDGAVEHPRKDLLRVVEQIPWFAHPHNKQTRQPSYRLFKAIPHLPLKQKRSAVRQSVCG